MLSTAALCLALNVYHEARSESVAGQYAVALVTMNRADHRPKRVCNTVFAPHQFSWTNGLNRTTAANFKPREKDAWETAKMVAVNVLGHKIYDFTGGATYYHTRAVRPTWRRQLVRTRVIGSHVFYRTI